MWGIASNRCTLHSGVWLVGAGCVRAAARLLPHHTTAVASTIYLAGKSALRRLQNKQGALHGQPLEELVRVRPARGHLAGIMR